MITLCYITNRDNPLFQWFADSIKSQLSQIPVPVQILVIDYHGRKDYFNQFIKCDVVKPLPSAVQGEHRLTKENWFSASVARNTGIVYAIHPYIQFVDDLSVLIPNWLFGVYQACIKGVVLQSSYRKDKEMVVENGLIVSSVHGSQDARSHHSRNNAGRPEWCYGNLGLPLELALKCNGYDELCSITGYEDVNFGLRLGKAGAKFFYNQNVLAVESEEHHHIENNYFKRQDPEVSEEQYRAVCKNFGCEFEQPHNGRFDASHAQLLIAKQKTHKASWNPYDLRELRRKRESGEEITVDDMKFYTLFWFTGQPLSEI